VVIEFITPFFVVSGLGSLILRVDIFREVIRNFLEGICREECVYYILFQGLYRSRRG
jgi:hypothetical protein